MCETSITAGLETISIHLLDFDLRKWESTVTLHVFSLFACVQLGAVMAHRCAAALYSSVMFLSDENLLFPHPPYLTVNT